MFTIKIGFYHNAKLNKNNYMYPIPACPPGVPELKKAKEVFLWPSVKRASVMRGGRPWILRRCKLAYSSPWLSTTQLRKHLHQADQSPPDTHQVYPLPVKQLCQYPHERAQRLCSFFQRSSSRGGCSVCSWHWHIHIVKFVSTTCSSRGQIGCVNGSSKGSGRRRWFWFAVMFPLSSKFFESPLFVWRLNFEDHCWHPFCQ